MYKARIEDWHGDEWKTNRTRQAHADAAEECVERYIAHGGLITL